MRSGWRALLFLMLFILMASAAGVISRAVVGFLGVDAAGDRGALLGIDALVSIVPVLLAGWACARYLESLPFRSLGASLSKGWAVHLLFGLALGAATLVFAVAIAVAAGGQHFELNNEATAGNIARGILISLGIFVAAAAFEEALFRGYVLQTFTRSGLAWVAIALTSAFFGLVHAGNPNATAVSVANTVLAGIWFGIAYLKTRDLWFVFGIHLMWNWVQGAVFGIEVSGLTGIAAEPLLREIDSGPTWLTGATYGLEGGIACTIAIAASTAAIYFLRWPRPGGEMLAMTSPQPGVSGDLDLEGNVDGAGRVGQTSDRDKIHTGVGE